MAGEESALATSTGADPLAILIAVSLVSTMPFKSPIGAPSNALMLGEIRGVDYGVIVRIGLVSFPQTPFIICLPITWLPSQIGK